MYDILAAMAISCIAFLIVFCLIRCVGGPRIADRIVAVNSIGTMTIVIIAILSVLLEEAYLLDVCLIYAMLSFVAVIVLTKIYTGVYREEHPVDNMTQKKRGEKMDSKMEVEVEE